MATEIVIILILIIFNGILSASEIAIVSSRKSRLQPIADKKNPAAKKALELKENPNRFLSTIQIGITLIGILTGFFSGGTISIYLADVLNNIPFLAPYSSQIAIILVLLIITYLSLIIGELVPKRIGMAIPERYAMFVAIPMSFLSKVVRPFVWLLSVSTDFIVKLFNIKTTQNTVTEEEIKALVDEGVDSGIIENIEHDLVDRILRLGDKKAINLMVHRSRITYLDLNSPFISNKHYILEHEHTEYPVCDGNFDHIKGIVHIKSLFKEYLNNPEPNLEQLIQPIPFVNENSYAYNVLETLRNSKVSQAVVIDEYGSPQGIITMKDIVGSLLGGLEVEEVSGNKHIREREDGSFMVDGSYQIEDFFNFFHIELTDHDDDEIGSITTIAGLVFLLLDHIPEEGDSVVYKNLKFEVIDMDAHRIDKLSVIKLQDGSETPETSNID